MIRKILTVLVAVVAVFVIGGIGGTVAERVAVPWLAAQPGMRHLAFLNDATERVTVITKTEEHLIRPDQAVRRVANQIRQSLCGVVVAKRAATAIVPGVVVTGDGVIVAPAAAIGVPHTTAYPVIRSDGTRRMAALVGVDPVTDLAFLRLEGDPVPSLGFARYEDIFIGQDLIAAGWHDSYRDHLAAVSVAVAALDDLFVLPHPSLASADRWQGRIVLAQDYGNGGDVLVTDRGEIMGMIVGDDATRTVLPVAALRFSLDRLRLGLIDAAGASSHWGLSYAVRTVADQEGAAGTGEAAGSLVVTAITPGSAAARGGVLPGDVIMAVGETAVDGAHPLPQLLGAVEGDTTVRLSRRGEERTVTLSRRD